MNVHIPTYHGKDNSHTPGNWILFFNERKTTINLILFFVVSLALITNTYGENKGCFSHLKGAKAPICSIKIVNVYPHDSLAFTQD